jgi:acyl-CoA thioesterase-1
MVIMKITKITCLGDSLTWGFPFGPEYSWVHLSSKVLGLTMINRGVNGDTVEDLLSRFDRDVLKEKPSHLFIMAGTNDAAINLTLKQYQDKMLIMLAKTIITDIIPIIGLPIPSYDRWLERMMEKYRVWLREFAVLNKMDIIDFSPAMLTLRGEVNPDCYLDEVHPSKQGYVGMSKIFIEFCQKHI